MLLKTKVHVWSRQTINIAFCSLVIAALIFNVFSSKFFALRLFSLDIVLTSKITCSWKNIFIIQTHPSEGVQKNMLKSWDFTKNKLCHKYFENNLQKIYRTNILKKWHQTNTFDSFLMVGLWLKLQTEIVD